MLVALGARAVGWCGALLCRVALVIGPWLELVVAAGYVRLMMPLHGLACVVWLVTAPPGGRACASGRGAAALHS